MPEAGWNQNASLWLASCYMSFLPRATSPELLSLGIGLSLHVCPSLFEGYIYSPINFGDWYWLVRCQAMQDSTRSARFSGWKPSTWNESDRILAASCSVVKSNELKQNPQQQHYYEWNQWYIQGREESLAVQTDSGRNAQTFSQVVWGFWIYIVKDK